MRTNTQRIYELMSRGTFISVDSADTEIKHLYADIVDKLVDDLVGMGFAELINEQDGTYKVTSAFHYAEELVNLITIYNEDDATEGQ